MGISSKHWEMDFPHSLGLLYSAFTYYTGFKVNSGEYKLMGLAPYGEPLYVDKIINELMDLKEDGTFRLNMECFNYATGLTMTNRSFDRSLACRQGLQKVDHSVSNGYTRSIQAVTGEIVLRLADRSC